MSSGVSGATSSSVRRRAERKRTASAVAVFELAAVAMAVRPPSTADKSTLMNIFSRHAPIRAIWDYNVRRSFWLQGGNHEPHLCTSS
jgi:hypothetical protein